MTCPHGSPKSTCLECLPARIRAKIEIQPNGCWHWVAAIGDHGYGMAWDPNRGSMVGAHRLVWELLVGAIPTGLHLDHSQGCKLRRCVRPKCLDPVTPAENNRRTMTTTCRRGHEWTEENTYLRPDTGGRQCRACILLRQPPVGRPPLRTVEDFWQQVDRSAGPDGCWPFTGFRDRQGYGRARCDMKNWMAHRLAYTLLVGPIPAGLTLDHYHCDNPPCCNPRHLRPTTAAANRSRGRYPNREKTVCKYGHELTPENVRLELKTGWRYCRACARRRDRERQQRGRKRRAAR